MKNGSCWYDKGLMFSCKQCGGCCTGDPGYVWISPEEIKQMSSFAGMPQEGFTRKYLRRARSKLSLKEKANGDCVLYKKNRCFVYSARPLQCRTYPFWRECLESEDSWNTYRITCPGMGQGRLYSREEIERILSGEDIISGKHKIEILK